MRGTSSSSAETRSNQLSMILLLTANESVSPTGLQLKPGRVSNCAEGGATRSPGETRARSVCCSSSTCANVHSPRPKPTITLRSSIFGTQQRFRLTVSRSSFLHHRRPPRRLRGHATSHLASSNSSLQQFPSRSGVSTGRVRRCWGQRCSMYRAHRAHGENTDSTHFRCRREARGKRQFSAAVLRSRRRSRTWLESGRCSTWCFSIDS